MSTLLFLFFFFNDTATTEIYTLSLHDALPISRGPRLLLPRPAGGLRDLPRRPGQDGRRRHHRHFAHHPRRDRKSTRLNSSHLGISYAVFCLKKKKKKKKKQKTTQVKESQHHHK